MPDDQLRNAVDNVEATELNNILDELAGDQKAISEATASLRSNLKSVLKDKGWNKAALAAIRGMHSKSASARADFLRTFDPMYRALLEAKWRDEMHDLVDEASDGGAD